MQALPYTHKIKKNFMLKNLRYGANFRIEQITEIQQQCFYWSESVIKYCTLKRDVEKMEFAH